MKKGDIALFYHSGKDRQIVGEVEIVKVTFSDGASTRVGWDHLWYVETSNQRNRNQVGHVMTTRQLVDSGLTVTPNQKSETFKWYIPMVKPVTYSRVDLAVEPYTLGV